MRRWLTSMKAPEPTANVSLGLAVSPRADPPRLVAALEAFGPVVLLEAASLTKGAPSAELPAVLILDWRAEGLNAAALLRSVRGQERMRDVPVLALTDSEGEAEEAIAAGADDCLALPWRESELQARVRTFVRLRREQENARRLEQKLARSAMDFERLVNINRVGTWELDPVTRSVQANERLVELFGLDRGEKHVDEFYARIHPDDVRRIDAAITSAIEGRAGGRFLVEYRLLRPGEPTVRWVEGRGQAYFNEAGKPERFFGTVMDITERKEAELAREGLIDALTQQSAAFVALVRGPGLVFEFANPSYESLFRGQQLVGRPLLEAIPELKGQGLDELMLRVMATGEPFVGRELVVPLVRGDEGVLQDVIFNFVYQPVRGATGILDGVLIVGVEVTREVQGRQEVEDRLAFEQRLTGIVGHDLRSPLSALVMSVSQLLPSGQHSEGLAPAQRRAIERIARGAQRIQAVISSLLDLTRARGVRGFPIRPQPSDLHETTLAALEEVRLRYPDRLVNYTHGGDTRGVFDSERLTQVTVNLLENAFKYGAPNADVSLRVEGREALLRLVVHNVGPAIPRGLQANLFQPFVRGPQSTDTVKVSIGLGLFIVREIVRAHGGQVSLESDEETGTTFTIELPRAPPSPESA